MKVAIIGQRDVKKESVNLIHKSVLSFIEDTKDNLVFLTGGATGVQEIVMDLVGDTFDVVVFKPWTLISKKLFNNVMSDGKFDPTFFFYRNIQIVDNSDLILVFTDGTKDAEVNRTLELCERKGKEFRVIKI